MLAHLPAVLGQDVAEAEHVAVAALVEDERADRHQRVEPAAGLVDRLADEVGRVGLAGTIGVAVRRAELGEGHRAGVEPGVDHGRHPPVHTVLAGTGEGDVIDIGPVRVGQVDAGQLTQLGQGTDADHPGRVRVVAPDRQRRAPVPVARQRPVDVVDRASRRSARA